MAEYIEREAAEKILYDGCHTSNGRECPDDVVEQNNMGCANKILPQLRGEDEQGGLTVYIGMNNYEYYIPEICDGHYCCRDCEKCPWAEEAMEYIMEVEGEADD